MPKLIFVEPDGREKVVTAKSGTNLMEVAMSHNVLGVWGKCGGNCSCGTCHVRIAAPFDAQLETRSSEEDAVLEAAATPPTAQSRLACQVLVTDALDGMRVEVAEEQ
jgi:2Fe-2S ferredoxin